MEAVSPEVAAVLPAADSGERDAVALAHQLGLAVLLDDRTARAAARRVGVSVFGTAGLLIEPKAAGLIPSVRTLLEQIRDNGNWLSDTLIDHAASLAGET